MPWLVRENIVKTSDFFISPKTWVDDSQSLESIITIRKCLPFSVKHVGEKVLVWERVLGHIRRGQQMHFYGLHEFFGWSQDDCPRVQERICAATCAWWRQF